MSEHTAELKESWKNIEIAVDELKKLRKDLRNAVNKLMPITDDNFKNHEKYSRDFDSIQRVIELLVLKLNYTSNIL